ncbi:MULTISPECIES: ABC transporter permease [Pseudomonadaceae]|uniref:Transport permease protein n=1 Tax=Pseudomonas denitrificans TaxID=43306 RepID=A0A9X7N325_PSEDE|nr:MULTISPECIES: ABC transporter permease [Pseudomonadaceae]MBD9633123.1 ABC transporter permease [Pseudomonas sp. PDM19]MBD9686263.1 ABC transporter permease [Pseudomonas sp. PDM20]QEY74128.1 ABC transporter permease [Pseudomonas denitrificans (nom. rej.)]
MSTRLHHAANPPEMTRSFWANRSIIWKMAVREVIGRYRGSIMGLAWSFFNPILLLVVYTFIFGVVFQSRWGNTEPHNTGDFAIIIFSGMIVHGLFAECFNRAPTLITGNPNYVKKIVFPLEILPWISMGAALFHTGISWLVLLVAELLLKGSIPLTTVLFPVVLLPLIILTMGFSWFLAALGAYLRDISQITGIITTVLMFLSPMFYPITAIPEAYRPLLYINPLTLIIEESREVLIWGNLPSITQLGSYYLVSVLIAWLGFWWFQKTRKGFADVL